MPMRRKDRQITDPVRIEAILRGAECCRLGLVDDGLAYIVPMSFGVAREGGALCLYFHSAPRGRKIELIEKAGRATFETEAGYAVKEGARACEFSCFYQSVIGHGRISILREDREKLRALRCVMEHYTGKEDWEILDKMLPVVVGIRLEIEEMTAKAHLPPVE
jgi:nitroimidazol reductase NimA-like FMN-containing flavoprotein (pyridoxamine 5'-phosphate oxidase superfamily)